MYDIKSATNDPEKRPTEKTDCLLGFQGTFSNISAISWRTVLVVEEAGVPGESHRPWTSNG
jgi:hypothetical protein